MPVILAADITVTVTSRVIHGRKKRHEGTMSFGNGVDAMPPQGLPRPTLSAFGFIRQLDELRFYPREGNVLNMEYSATDNAIHFMEDQESANLGDGLNIAGQTGDTPHRVTVDFVAIGW